MVHIFWVYESNLMLYYPMFESITVAYVNPSISCKMVLLLGNGKDVRTICLFTFLKSERNRIVWFDFWIINAGELDSDSGCLLRTPI